MKFCLIACVVLGAAAQAQAAPAGVLSEWDVQKLLQNLESQAKQLPEMIARVKPEAWVEKGAPETYAVQWKSSQAQLQYMLGSANALIQQPEKLTLALDAYFRMQAMETVMGSLIEGIRKYQDPELADSVQTLVNQNSANRDTLRQYIQDLAAEKEQEFTVADREAQRCRGVLLREPVPSARSTSRK